MVRLPKLSEIRRNLKKTEDIVLDDAKYFLAFVIVAILSILIFFRQTQDDITATIILVLLWWLFWKRSDLKGKVFLILASIVGYVHEIIGVYFGFFTYLGGFIGGVPLWVLPGYGAIFWASYNFWRVFEKNYSSVSWFNHINKIAFASFFVLLFIDYLWLGFMLEPGIILLRLLLAFLLFNNMHEIRLAYFVAIFTVFNEMAGEFIGTWSHPVFSIFSLMAGYVFLLWMCLTITDIIQGTKKWRLIEVLSAAAFFAVFGLMVLGWFF